MKFRIEIDENITEPEVVVRCARLTGEIDALQKAVSKTNSFSQQLILYKGETEYFLPISEILFFETDEKGVNAHTQTEVYLTKLKLYEIEDMFQKIFIRVSKSSIINVYKANAIAKNLSGCYVKFKNSLKEVYVSRMYYKPLKDRLEENRL